MIFSLEIEDKVGRGDSAGEADVETGTCGAGDIGGLSYIEDLLYCSINFG